MTIERNKLCTVLAFIAELKPPKIFELSSLVLANVTHRS
jgi:hypothetical protein